MRLRLAIPILAVSLGIMLAGLHLARAQEDAPPTNQPTDPASPPSDAPPQKTPPPANEPGADEPGATETKAESARERRQRRVRERLKRRRERRRAAKAKPPAPAPATGGASQAPVPAAAAAPAGQNAAPAPTTPGNLPPAAPPATDVEPPKPFESGIEYRPMPPRARVTFNLEEADLPDLVRLVSNITGKRFILPGKVRNIKATVFAPTKVTAAEAYNAFLSILEVNGLTVVPAGRYLKIVDTENIEGQPIPLYTGNRTPGTDRFVTRLYALDNISAEDVVTLLDRFKSRTGSVTAYAPTNTVIITDTGTQIRRMLRLIRAVDVERGGDRIWIEPIHYANASELAERLKEIFPTAGGESSSGGRAPNAARPPPPRPGNTDSPSPGGTPGRTVGSRSGESRITNLIADERTNSLVILATERAYLRLLEMIRQLDVPLEGEGRVHVHYVQNADATEIASTLQSLVGGGSPGGRRGATPGGGGGQAQPASGGGNTANLFEGQIRVTAHEASNALVITSSLHDYAALRTVIEQLDAPRRQVFIEAVIMEVDVNRSSDLGLSYHGGAGNFPADGSLAVLGFGATNSIAAPTGTDQTALTGLALGVRGPNIDNSQQLSGIGISVPAFGVVLNALATSGDSNVLSTPHIIAMDNVEAEISVGANVPLQTSAVPGLGGLGGLGNLAGLGGQQGQQGQGLAGLAGLAGSVGGAVPRQDVGTILRITPHINEADQIRLEIEEEISDRGPPDSGGNLGVASVNRNTARTEVMVDDQQTVVIGGLIRERVGTNKTKIPILGDIPLLGALFSRSGKTKEKKNLLLFLTPYIIREQADLRAIFERKMRERQEFLDRYFVFGDHKYEPTIDYSRTRGLVTEIINEIDEIDEKAELAADSEREPEKEHAPRSPVGAIEGTPGEGDLVIDPEAQQTNDSSATVAPLPDAASSAPLPESSAAPLTAEPPAAEPPAAEPPAAPPQNAEPPPSP